MKATMVIQCNLVVTSPFRTFAVQPSPPMATAPLTPSLLDAYPIKGMVRKCPLEQTLDALKLSRAYAQPLLALLGSHDRLLELDSARLSMLVQVVLPPQDAKKFLRHIQLVKNLRELQPPETPHELMAGYREEPIKSWLDVSPVSSMSFLEPRERPPPPSTGPFACLCVPLKAAFDHFFPAPAIKADYWQPCTPVPQKPTEAQTEIERARARWDVEGRLRAPGDWGCRL